MCGSIPTVSIIIPAYNHAPWVGQALDAVLQQSLADWELILIDDASQDATWEVVVAWVNAQAEPIRQRTRLLRHTQNQGAPATLNEGLGLARGEYVAILNSDDVWHPERLARLHDVAQQQGLDFVATAVDLWDADSQPKDATEPDWLAWYAGLAADYRSQGDFLRTLLRGNFFITTSNFFFRREVCLAQGGFADLRYVHDYEYVLRLTAAGLRLHCLWDEPLLHYRLHGSNTIREKPLAAIEENMQMLLGQLPLLHAELNQTRLQGLQIQLRDLYRYTREEWLAAIHHRLRERESTLFTLIADRDGWIAERDALIAQQQQWVTDRDGWIAGRDAQISGLQQALATAEAWVRDRDGWIAERDALIGRQQQWVQDRDGWIAERDAWIAERDAALVRVRHEHDALLNSRAYRLGMALLHPLRSLRARILPQKWGVHHA